MSLTWCLEACRGALVPIAPWKSQTPPKRRAPHLASPSALATLLPGGRKSCCSPQRWPSQRERLSLLNHWEATTCGTPSLPHWTFYLECPPQTCHSSIKEHSSPLFSRRACSFAIACLSQIEILCCSWINPFLMATSDSLFLRLTICILTHTYTYTCTYNKK